MKKVLVLFAGLLFLFVSSRGFCQEYAKAELLTLDGIATKITRLNVGNSVIGTFKGKRSAFNFKTIKRVESLGNDKGNKLCSFRITNLSDEQFTLENATLNGNGVIEYFYFDEVSKEEKKASFFNFELNILTISGDIGRLKFNPKTKKYFPPDYVFDTLSGETLEWKNPEY